MLLVQLTSIQELVKVTKTAAPTAPRLRLQHMEFTLADAMGFTLRIGAPYSADGKVSSNENWLVVATPDILYYVYVDEEIARNNTTFQAAARCTELAVLE
jgi:hypothetical protein